MKIEEFIALGCLNCGMHEFSTTGAIFADGPEEITCALCSSVFNRERIGELDSLSWERERNYNLGIPFEEPRTVQYQNEEQFIENFEEKTQGFYQELKET